MGVSNPAALVLRVVVGGLMTGHGAQTLFGWRGGYGLDGTSGWLECMGLRPGRPRAILAGGSELWGRSALALGVPQPAWPSRGYRVRGHGREKGALGQADLGYRRRP